MPERILVGCPIHECKEYSMERWWAAVRALTYPNIEVFCVDNSPTEDFAIHWMARGINIKRLPEPDPHHAMLRITESMEVMRQHFLASDCERWFNLECDVIPPPDVIEQMLAIGGDADWISHAYPMRGNQTDDQQGIGCSILSRRLMEAHDFASMGDNSPDGTLWARIRPTRKWKVMELWGYFPVQHLEE